VRLRTIAANKPRGAATHERATHGLLIQSSCQSEQLQNRLRRNDSAAVVRIRSTIAAQRNRSLQQLWA